jgi:Malectin domain
VLNTKRRPFSIFANACNSFTWPWARFFDIQVENVLVADLDLFVMGGYKNKVALQRRVTVVVTDANLTIQLLENMPKIDSPKLSGIEVTLAPPLPPTLAPRNAPTALPTPIAAEPAFQPILINCGAGQYIDSQRRVWMADTYWTGGLGTFGTNKDIAETVRVILVCVCVCVSLFGLYLDNISAVLVYTWLIPDLLLPCLPQSAPQLLICYTGRRLLVSDLSVWWSAI